MVVLVGVTPVLDVVLALSVLVAMLVHCVVNAIGIEKQTMLGNITTWLQKNSKSDSEHVWNVVNQYLRIPRALPRAHKGCGGRGCERSPQQAPLQSARVLF